MTNRTADVRRETRETKIKVSIDLDGNRQIGVRTGLGFLDHMLSSLAFHAGWDLSLQAEGDLHVDDHHTIEDCGLALGEAFKTAIGNKQRINRFGSKYAPLDESLARCVIDLSGRPFSEIQLGLQRESIGEVACENLAHFFQSLAVAGQFTLHLDLIRGSNDHHRAEAAFKATALALREASAHCSSLSDTEYFVPSTKGSL